MGCCGSLTSSSNGLPPINAIPPEPWGQRQMESGETVECWAARTQGTDDKSGGTPPPGKIITAGIAVACDLSFNQRIDAFPAEGTTVASWAYVAEPAFSSGISFAAGTEKSTKFSGTFTADEEGKEFTIDVTVTFSDGTTDTKRYMIKPTKCTEDEDSITLINPMPGSRITAPFNEVRQKSDGSGTRAHKGLDFGNGGNKGRCVAAADGKVIGVNKSQISGGAGYGGYGYWILIQHSNKKGKPMCNSFYAHMDSISVSTGDTVSKGQDIGVVGGSGSHGMNSYTPHLHFELHIQGMCKDPAAYIQPAAPVKAGVNKAPLMTGFPPAPGNSSGNYGPAPEAGKTTSGPDGYQSEPAPNENKGKAINNGTVEMASKQCDKEKEEKPLPPQAVGVPTPCGSMVTLEQLQKSMPGSGSQASKFLDAINTTIKDHVLDGLTDPCGDEAKQRVAMFLAQVGHETGSLKWQNEIWGPTAAQTRYEGRKDLGNVQPGDGAKFAGRGLIQLTGRSNYQAFSTAIGDPSIMSDPQKVATDTNLCAKAAGWFL